MRMSELLFRAAAQVELKRQKAVARREQWNRPRGRSEKGLVWIPNRIRKRFGMAER